MKKNKTRSIYSENSYSMKCSIISIPFISSIAFYIHQSSLIIRSHTVRWQMDTDLVLVQTYRKANWPSGTTATGLEPSLHHPILVFYVKTLKTPPTLTGFSELQKKSLVSRSIHKYSGPLVKWIRNPETWNFAWVLPINSSGTLEKSLHFSTCQYPP